MVAKIYTDEAAARKHLEKLLWPEGPMCPHCGSLDAGTKLKGKSTRPGVYWCNACQKPYSVTVGTVMESSHIPLHKWLYATYLLTTSKKGISAHQLMRMLELGSYRSAWFLAHRIREAFAPVAGQEPPLGGDGFVVEVDETEISPSRKSRPRERAKNMKFVSLIERGGRVRSHKITGAKGPIGIEVRAAIRDHLDATSTLHTDGAQHFETSWPLAQREAVNHNKKFVRYTEDGPVHVNSAEGYFSIFKRGLVGTYQHMSEQHLHRYLAEFDFRMSNRAKLGIDDNMRAEIALQGIVGKRLTYRPTHNAQDTAPDGRRVHSVA